MCALGRNKRRGDRGIKPTEVAVAGPAAPRPRAVDRHVAIIRRIILIALVPSLNPIMGNCVLLIAIFLRKILLTKGTASPFLVGMNGSLEGRLRSCCISVIVLNELKLTGCSFKRFCKSLHRNSYHGESLQRIPFEMFKTTMSYMLRKVTHGQR